MKLLLLFILFNARFGPPNGSMQAEVLLWEKLNEKTQLRATLGRCHSSAIRAPQPHLMPCYGLPIKPTGCMSQTISLHIISIFTTSPATGMGSIWLYPPCLFLLQSGTGQGSQLRLAIVPPLGHSFSYPGSPLHVPTCIALLGHVC